MKVHKLILINAISLLIFIGCHAAFVTKFDNSYYPPTQDVKVYTDLSTIPEDYIEIGYVEAKGGITVSKQELLDDMKEEAKKYGADALIKIEFYDRERYDRYIGSYSTPAAKAVMIRFKSNLKK
jgi:hypothetical protein